MKNSPTSKIATPRAGKGAKGKAKETAAPAGPDGRAAAAPQPFVFLPPPSGEALSVADSLDEQGEIICTGETTLKQRADARALSLA